jgi:hypothetical protein
MSTCPPNLIHSFLTVCKIITLKVDKKVFFPSRKDEGPFSQKKCSNRPFLTQEAFTIFLFFFEILTVRSYPRLLREHVQIFSKKLTARIVRL